MYFNKQFGTVQNITLNTKNTSIRRGFISLLEKYALKKQFKYNIM